MSGSDAEAEQTVELGDLTDLPDGQMRCFENIGDYGIVVCRVAGTLYAAEDNCSHAASPLSEGRLRGHTLTCAMHGAQFDVRDGSHLGPPAWEGISCYPVEERDGAAIVNLEDFRDNTEGQGKIDTVFRTR